MWTKIAKPVSSVWTAVNPRGKEQYDQASLTYNDANTYYDGIVPLQWTGIAKPSTNAWVNVSKPI